MDEFEWMNGEIGSTIGEWVVARTRREERVVGIVGRCWSRSSNDGAGSCLGLL